MVNVGSMTVNVGLVVGGGSVGGSVGGSRVGGIAVMSVTGGAAPAGEAKNANARATRICIVRNVCRSV